MLHDSFGVPCKIPQVLNSQIPERQGILLCSRAPFVFRYSVLTFIHSLVPTPKFNPFLLHHSLTSPSPPPPTASSIASSISQVLYSTLNPLLFHHSNTLACPFLVAPTSTWLSKIILLPFSSRQTVKTSV